MLNKVEFTRHIIKSFSIDSLKPAVHEEKVNFSSETLGRKNRTHGTFQKHEKYQEIMTFNMKAQDKVIKKLLFLLLLKTDV